MEHEQRKKGRPSKSRKARLNVRIRVEVLGRLRQAAKSTEVFCEHVEQVLIRGLARGAK